MTRQTCGNHLQQQNQPRTLSLISNHGGKLKRTVKEDVEQAEEIMLMEAKAERGKREKAKVIPITEPN